MTAFTFKDSCSLTSGVTGSNQLFIQNYSYLYITPGTVTAKNVASIVKYAAICNGDTSSISRQTTDLTEFDETLVKRWVQKITVRPDRYTVELKSGLSVDIEG